MEQRPLPHKKIIYVCLNERDAGACCARSGSEVIHSRLKEAVKVRKLNQEVRVSRSGCMGRCQDGPNVLVFPDGVWFSGVTAADVDTILEQALKDVGVTS